jgi:hypothetical protein
LYFTIPLVILQSNTLSGTIPGELEFASKLEYLFLDNNMLNVSTALLVAAARSRHDGHDSDAL